jgi:cytochrome c551/c552
MSRSTERQSSPCLGARAFLAVAAATLLALSGQALAQSNARPWTDIGRSATPAEIKAWDIDVRADFKGLPAGSGSVANGQDVWEAKCANCHGIFGESNEVFSPIVGGTTKDDVRTGRVANLLRADYPQRTTLMKVSQISTLWDYINRAMPWNAPKSLSVEEVYSVVAYILHLGDVLPADFVLSERNMAEVQQRLPNRNGKATYKGLWELAGKPDVQGDPCLSNCRTASLDERSRLPEFARNAHGNLAEQNRVVGPFRGADTTKPPARDPLRLAAAAGTQAAVTQVHIGKGSALKPPIDIARDAACLACHAANRRLVGPSFREVAERYKSDPKAEDLLALKVRNGGQGNWGAMAMPSNAQLHDDDLRAVVRWILGGAR